MDHKPLQNPTSNVHFEHSSLKLPLLIGCRVPKEDEEDGVNS